MSTSQEPDGSTTTRDEAVARVVTLAMLLTKGPVTLQEICECMPQEYAGSAAASRKRFQRDKQTLEAVGLRITVDDDRYWLSTPTPPHRRGLVAAERFALGDAVEAVSGTVDADVNRLATAAVLKLRAADADPQVASDSVSPGADTTVVAFENARRTGVALEFTYTSADGVATDRLLHPWAVALRNDVWIVLGWDETRAAPRRFRIDGVKAGSVRSADVAYRPSPGVEWLTAHFANAPWAWGGGPQLDAEVLLVGTEPPVLDDLPPDSRIEPTDDGHYGFRVTVAVRDPGPFMSWLLRFGDRAKLVAPDGLVELLHERLQTVVRDLRSPAVPFESQAFDAVAPATPPESPTVPVGSVAALGPSARRTARILQLLGLASGAHVERERLADLLGCSLHQLDDDLDQLSAHCYLPPDSGGNWFDVNSATIGQSIDPTTVGGVPSGSSVRIIGPDPGRAAGPTGLELAALGICTRVYLTTHPTTDDEARVLRDALEVLGLTPPGVTEPTADGTEFPAFAAIATALRNSRRIRLTYTTDGETTTREVDPQRLSVAAGHRYVTGWDHLREGQRAFRLDRIESLEVTDTVFDPAALPPLPTRIDGDPGFVPVGDGAIEVLVPASWSRWAERRFGPSAVRHGDGSSLITLRSNDPTRYAPTLLAMLPDCTLVGPQSARDAVLALAESILHGSA